MYNDLYEATAIYKIPTPLPAAPPDGPHQMHLMAEAIDDAVETVTGWIWASGGAHAQIRAQLDNIKTHLQTAQNITTINTTSMPGKLARWAAENAPVAVERGMSIDLPKLVSGTASWKFQFNDVKRSDGTLLGYTPMVQAFVNGRDHASFEIRVVDRYTNGAEFVLDWKGWIVPPGNNARLSIVAVFYDPELRGAALVERPSADKPVAVSNTPVPPGKGPQTGWAYYPAGGGKPSFNLTILATSTKVDWKDTAAANNAAIAAAIKKNTP